MGQVLIAVRLGPGCCILYGNGGEDDDKNSAAFRGCVNITLSGEDGSFIVIVCHCYEEEEQL